jgi:hypothetical protein
VQTWQFTIHEIFWLFETKLLNLDFWGPGGTMRSPTRWGSNSIFKTSNSKHPRKKMALWNKTIKFRCFVIWNWGLGGTLRSPTLLGSNSTFKTSNSKHTQNNLFPLAKTAKYRRLVIWNQGPGGTMSSRRVGGPLPPSKPQIQNTHKEIWLFEPNLLNLNFWWFEIGVPVELRALPHVGGPLPPSKPWIKTPTKKFDCFNHNS